MEQGQQNGTWWDVAKPPDVGLMAIPEVDWKDNVLVFNRQLTIDKVDQIYSGLKKFGGGHQLYWTDLWHEVEAMGIDWTQYVPDSMPKKTAGNWFRMGDRFTADLRLGHKHLKASHYIAASQFKLPTEDAIRIIEAAEEGEWSVKGVEKAVKLVMGVPEKVKKPKFIICPHCDRWTVEGLDCQGCQNDILITRVEAFRAMLQEVANPSGDLEWVAGLAERALEEI